MPFAVSCPDCTTKLRSANPMKVGNKITCPKCQFVFRIEPGDSVEEMAAPDAKTVGQHDFDLEPMPPAAPVKKTFRPAPAEPRKPAEQPPRPARRAAPPPEADDEEAAPDRPKKKKKLQKTSNILFMVSLLVVSAILIGGIVYVFLEFANAPADKDLLVYAPAGTETIFGIAVEEIAAQDKLVAFLKKSVGKGSPILDEVLTGTKTAFEDIAKLVLMESPTNGSVLAVKLRKEKSLDHAALMRVNGASEGRAGSKTYAKLPQGFVCCINARTFVATQTEAAMKAILIRETQEVQLGEDMKFLASRAGRSGQIYLAVGSGSTPAGNMGKAVVGEVMMLKSFGSDGRGIIAFASPSLDAVDLGLGILFNGRATAQASMKTSDRAIFEMRDKLEQNGNALSAAGYGRAAFIKEVMEKVDTSSDGELVVTRSTVPMKFFEPLVSQLTSNNNNMMGGTLPVPKVAPK